MNPLNAQQQPPAAQYFITGMPSLTPATATSILKSNTLTSAAPKIVSQQQTVIAPINNGSSKSPVTGNNLLEPTNYVTTATNYVPVLLTNQTLISSVGPGHQQQQPQVTKITPGVISHAPCIASSTPSTNMPAVAGGNNNNKSMVITTSNTGNISYQVLGTSQTSNLAPVITSPNGTVSVLLTPSTPMAPAGHVAAPMIIRNTSSAGVIKPAQIKHNLPLNQQQQQQQQFQNAKKLHSFNPQSFNADILKQIVVGNTGAGATANLAPGTTLLKPTILKNKPTIQQQQQIQKKAIVNNKMLLTAPHQQQQQQTYNQIKNINHTVITTTPDNSTQVFAALGMELVKAPALAAHSNVTQNVQKLPQVSLLQNSNKKITSIVEANNESVKILKNPNEIKVGNLNSEVSLIKKPNISIEKSKEASLLKISNNLPAENKLNTQKTVDHSNKDILPTNKDVPLKETYCESYSLLKSSKDTKKNCQTDNSITKLQNTSVEKQKSLLKSKNKASPERIAKEVQQKSSRFQRSNSCHAPKTQKTASNSNVNERRHSEPCKIESVQNCKTTTSDKPSQQADFKKSEELDIFFEDEEYLESSGEKSTDISEKSLIGNSPQNQPKNIESKKISTQEISKEKEILSSTGKTENIQTKIQETKNDSKKNSNNEIEITSDIDKENKVSEENVESDDDDVTILPMEDVEIEQIEIDDDDEEENIAQNNKSISPDRKQELNLSLLCDEQIQISSSSSLSNNSSDQISASASSALKYPKIESTSTPLLKKTLMEKKHFIQKDEPQSSGYSAVLDMLSNFNMLNWRERIGTARGTTLKFQLNEFNLIQLFERNLGNKRIHTAYEKPIYERESSQKRTENKETLLYYTCRRCNVQGPSVDFLAPEFCSLACLKRDSRKRRDDAACIIRKHHRYAENNNSNGSRNSNVGNPPPLTYIKLPKFRWSNYLKNNSMAIAAPISLFLNPFPTGPNNFMVGMKLEAIDPENCSLFCVCTIIDIMGYRLKLSFDGYDSAYDFWLNADSMDIFPPGWCAKTNRILQPPKSINPNKFNWSTYLNKEKAMPAPRHLFTHLNSSSLVPRNPFKIGMHLEAEDLNDTGKLCVASVADVLDDRIRIHFDGWDDCYDIIVDINSPYIHPCGWHESRQQLVVPPDCENTAFNWTDYIRNQGTGEAASEELFAPREPIGFKPNMKLEVVDPRNPSLIRPATVVSHKGHRVKLHLDGWPSDYCFWLEDDSPDLHPIGWCDATGHDLEPPPGFQMSKQKMPCTVTGCRGIGNAKKAFMSVHDSRDSCPYAAENWRIVVEKPQRVNYENIVRTLPKPSKVNQAQQVQPPQPRLSEQQILERLQMLDNIKTRNVLIQQDKLPTNQNNFLGFSLPNPKTEETKESKIIPTLLTSNSISSSPAIQQHMPHTDTETIDINLDITKEFLYDYGPRLQQNYALWQKNFAFDAEKIKRNPLKWSSTEVSVFVDLYLNCRKTANIFNQEDIDGEAFLLLQQQDLTEKLGLKLGPAVKLYTCILQLRTLAVTKFEVAYKKVTMKK